MTAIKGEVPFTVGGAPFTLVYDFNALCSIEEQLDVKVEDVGERLSSPTMIRSVFRIGLEAHHGALSDLEAGRMIHELGVATAGELIGAAFKAAFPDAKLDASAEGKAKPGTGRKR